MSSNLPAPLLPEQASEIINRWAARGYYRLRNMGDKVFIREILGGWAYSIRLQTHYEERTVSQAQEPYRGGPVDDRGRPPDAWDVVVQRPGEFQERTESLPVPHTERVGTCMVCQGAGQVGCGLCVGTGQTVCPQCGGSAMQQHSITEMGRGSQGESAPSVRIVHRPCPCGNGRIRCLKCSGQGHVVCHDCRGSGQVKSFERLLVKFLRSRNSDLLDVTPVPDNWFGRLTGELIVEERGPLIEQFPSVNEDVDGRARKLLDRSHQIEERQTRILLQHLQIERIPLHEVRYTYAGADLQLWICGNESEIHAPGAPWNRGRLVGTLLGTTFAILAVIGLLVFLLTR